MKKFLRFTSIILALIVCLSFSTTSFAMSADYTEEMALTSDESVMPIGSLSGYSNFHFEKGDTSTGPFPIQVTGSWSPWAGCTIKTEFDDYANITVYLTRPDGSKIGDTFTFSKSQEHAFTIFNVPTGEYKVCYSIDTNSSGNITVWIY